MHVGGIGAIGRNTPIITPDLVNTILPDMTAESTGGFTITASAYRSGNDPWRCASSAMGAEDRWNTEAAPPAWLRVDFPNWTPLCGFAIYYKSGIWNPTGWRIEYYEEDTWKTAQTYTDVDNDSNTYHNFTLSTPIIVRGFRFYQTASGGYAGIYKLKVFGGSVV